MCLNTRRLVAILFVVVGLAVGGCYTTATRAQVYEEVRQYGGDSLGAKLVHKGSDQAYDYYLIEDTGGNVLKRYRVPRHHPGGT